MTDTLVLYNDEGHYDFGTGDDNLTHGEIVAPQYELKESIHTAHGLIGAAAQYSERSTRVITVAVTVLNFATKPELREHVAIMQSVSGISGKLHDSGVIWPECTFRGFSPNGPPFFDASGQHGWVQFGTLSFRQIATEE